LPELDKGRAELFEGDSESLFGRSIAIFGDQRTQPRWNESIEPHPLRDVRESVARKNAEDLA